MIKKFMQKLACFVTVAAIIFSGVASYSPLNVQAEELTADEIRDKIEQLKQDNEDRENKINNLEGSIAENEEKKQQVYDLITGQKALMDYYSNLAYMKNEEVNAKQTEIDGLQTDIDNKQLDIEQTQLEIENKEAENEANLEKFADIVRTMYTTSPGDIFSVLFGAGDFYTMTIGGEVLGNISEKNLEFMNQLKTDIATLESDKKQFETDKQLLEEDKKALEAEKVILEEKKQEYDSLYYNATSAADEYQKQYNQYQADIDADELEKNNLEYLNETNQAEIDAFEEKLKEIIQAASKPDRPHQEGEWIWPVPGRGYITTYFGWDSYLSRWHKGIDIGDAGINGDPIYCSKAGVVIVAEYTYIPGYSYGKYVVVDHGGGYTTTYAHMSGVEAYVGQEVAQGDILGYVGNTGYSFGPHLHFEVRINGEPVDPFNYVSIA